MQDSSELKKALRHAEEKYEAAKKNLETAKEDPESLSAAAQRANDAWLEFKKTQSTIHQSLILKKLGDLYGC